DRSSICSLHPAGHLCAMLKKRRMGGRAVSPETWLILRGQTQRQPPICLDRSICSSPERYEQRYEASGTHTVSAFVPAMPETPLPGSLFWLRAVDRAGSGIV